MKNLFLLAAMLMLWQVSAQQKITSSQWQEDLRFLQNTVHKDYPFLFKKTTATKFDTAVEEFYTAIPQMQDHEVLVGFTKIIGMFKYGHTRVSFSEGPVPYQQLPLYTHNYKDGVYIHGAHKTYEALVGAKILEVEGKPIAEVLEAIYPVVPVENEQFFKAYGGIYLVIPEVLHAQGITETLKNKITFKLEKEGKTFTTVVTAGEPKHGHLAYGEVKPDSDWVGARDQSESPYYLKNLEKIYYFEYLPNEKAVYVRHSQIQDDPSENIPAFYKRLFEFIDNNEVEKLVLDVRLNGGGNNYKNKPIVTGIIEHRKINQPGKFFVIIGRDTFSACQNLVNELDNYTNAIFVGEPTGENINFYGDNRRVELPNSKLPVYLSFAWWQDKPQWENADYTVPHLAMEPTFAQYSANEDPVLEAALNFSADNFIIDPMGYLTRLFMDEKYELLATEAQRLVKDPAYKFFNFEAEFNKAGYQMLGSGQFEGALYVFEMNTKLFPESANAWDSLAEGYWKSGDLVKAKEYYNKAISLNPKGATGDNARRMLIEMEKGH
ncbi:MAG: tetratricopeptide repeat protein [Eudoraea sp.]|uniref:tetratricopeptide repeat protein n=2 Tax=Eudoraea sp. TaxID=1979955 RepID=UPI003C717C09